MTLPPNNRENNFDFLRQFAAFLVIIGHSQSLVGQSASGLWGVSISTLGVQIFFAISGYLVSDSWMRTPQLGSFLKKRSFRIFPALIVCTLLSALVLGPIFTSLSFAEYMQHSGTRHYLWNALLHPIYFLPGVFENNIYPNAVNGSLWSLPVEFSCYIGVLVTGLLVRKAMPVLALLVGAGMLFTVQYVLGSSEQIVIYGSPLQASLTVIPFFVGGAFFRMISRPGLYRADVSVLAFGLLTAIGIMRPDMYWAVTWLAIPYLVLCFGLSSLPVLRRFGRLGDPSYGMYLYSFPIQQILQHISGNTISLTAMICLTLIISVVLGLMSWYLVERPILRVTKRGISMPLRTKSELT